MKILIIEHEQKLLQLTLSYLKKEGYVCEQASTFKESYKKINNHEYDCVIVDPNLPEGDGWKLVQMLCKGHQNQTGIIIVSNNNSVENRISGLNSGADDYLSKPYNPGELNARIKAILRRKTNQFSNELIFGDLSIYLEKRQVVANGVDLHLTKKEYDILVYLARNKNRVVTKDSIAEHLWGDYMDDAVSFDFIYAHLKNLRKKLEENACGSFLKTVYGIGYKFQTY